MWEIAFDANEIYNIYKKLINFKANNFTEVVEIANWYKDNFFVEPTEKTL